VPELVPPLVPEVVSLGVAPGGALVAGDRNHGGLGEDCCCGLVGCCCGSRNVCGRHAWGGFDCDYGRAPPTLWRACRRDGGLGEATAGRAIDAGRCGHGPVDDCCRLAAGGRMPRVLDVCAYCYRRPCCCFHRAHHSVVRLANDCVLGQVDGGGGDCHGDAADFGSRTL
jgi:hypothetical protein